MRLSILIVAAALALAPMAQAAPARSAADRQSLLDLAFVLGRSHALRQACAGAGDQYWRTRMSGLLTAEAPEPAFGERLKQAFNTGFAGTQATFPRCTPRVAREEAAAAARGRTLATSLTGPVAEDDPSR
jgi:uncharacterized protein (TIGR02301 family)